MLRLILLLLFTPSLLLAQKNVSVTTGPENGSLMVVGGGGLGDELVSKFIELAGGPDSEIVYIPTAGGSKSYSNNYEDYNLAVRFIKAGAKNVTILHTTDRNEANSETFIEPLKTADAVWFSGGRQWRLVDSYKDTRTEEMFWKVLDRGGAIGGSSAGATIQGSYLARGDTKNNQIMMGDHEEGFGFIKNIAIDQHVIARNRQFDMFNILDNKPELLGLSIDERTAIIVNRDKFEVMGRSYVIMYDGKFWSREGSELKSLPKDNLFYFLRAGDKYDLRSRQVIVNED